MNKTQTTTDEGVIYSPPDKPNTTPLDNSLASDPTEKPQLTEKEWIEESFDAGQLNDYGVVMRVPSEEVWLCLNWVFYRLEVMRCENELLKKPAFDQAKREFLGVNATPMGTTDYSPDKLIAKLSARFQNLEACEINDEEADVILWKSGKDRLCKVGHIQVRYKHYWESKLSLDFYVISHKRDAYTHFKGTENHATDLAMEICGAMKWKV